MEIVNLVRKTEVRKAKEYMEGKNWLLMWKKYPWYRRTVKAVTKAIKKIPEYAEAEVKLNGFYYVNADYYVSKSLQDTYRLSDKYDSKIGFLVQLGEKEADIQISVKGTYHILGTEAACDDRLSVAADINIMYLPKKGDGSLEDIINKSLEVKEPSA